MTVIFARPRWDYAPYCDLYRLIELSGYPLIYADEIDPARADATYVCTILNGEITSGWPGARARIVLYDLEWHMDGLPVIPGLAEVWAADASYARHIGARYVPLGSHAGLPLSPKGERAWAYHLAMLAYKSARRWPIHNSLRDSGLRLAPDGQGEARDELLWRSKMMLHVHQHDGARTVAPQRFAIAAAYRMPLVAEWPDDMGIFRDGPVVWARYGDLTQTVHHWLGRADLPAYGDALHELLCERYTFRKCIEAAL